MKIITDTYIPANIQQTAKTETQEQEQEQGIEFAAPAVEILDSLEISDEGANKAKNDKAELARVQSETDELRRQLEAAKQQGEALAAEMEIRLKCLLIAMRIIKGDEVPRKDHSFLVENDIGLYGKALSMRMENDHPERHKRVSEDEEPETSGGDDTTVEVAQPQDGEVAVEAEIEVSTAETSAEE